MERSKDGKNSVLKDLDRDWGSFLAEFSKPGGKSRSLGVGGSGEEEKEEVERRGPEALRLNFDVLSDPTTANFSRTPKRIKLDRMEALEAEVVKARTEAAGLSSQLRTERRSGAEERAELRRRETAAVAAKQRAEERSAALEKEVAFLRNADTEAKAEKGRARRDSLARNLRSPGWEDASKARDREEELEAEVERLGCELRAAKAGETETRMGKEEAEMAFIGANATTERLKDQLRELADAKAAAAARVQMLEDEVRGLQDAGDMNIVMRSDLDRLEQYKKAAAQAQAQAQRYKSISENTVLLKEQLSSAKSGSERLQNQVDRLITENNELKLVLANGTGWEKGLDALDNFAAALQTKESARLAAEKRAQKAESGSAALEKALASLEEERDDLQHQIDILNRSRSKGDSMSISTTSAFAPPESNEVKEGLKVLHMSANPASLASRALAEEAITLRQEKARLELLVRALEERTGGEGRDENALLRRQEEEQALQTRLVRTIPSLPLFTSLSSLATLHSFEELEREKERLADQLVRTKAAYQDMTSRFRESCLELLGYQVKVKDGGDADIFQVASSFDSDNPNNLFYFRVISIFFSGKDMTSRFRESCLELLGYQVKVKDGGDADISQVASSFDSDNPNNFYFRVISIFFSGKDMTSRFRESCLELLGYQVKVKDGGDADIFQVASSFDSDNPNNLFYFRVISIFFSGKDMTSRFRESCLELLGYQVKVKDGGDADIFQVASSFDSDNPNNLFYFRVISIFFSGKDMTSRFRESCLELLGYQVKVKDGGDADIFQVACSFDSDDPNNLFYFRVISIFFSGKDMTSRFRESCLELLGYQVKVKDGGDADIFQVASSFDSDNPNNLFYFRRAGNDYELMDSDYAREWTDLMEMYLENDQSIPAFLAAVTLQLYQKEENSARL